MCLYYEQLWRIIIAYSHYLNILASFLSSNRILINKNDWHNDIQKKQYQTLLMDKTMFQFMNK